MPPELVSGSDNPPEPNGEASLASPEVAAALRPSLEQIFELIPGQTVEIFVLQDKQTNPQEAPKTPSRNLRERRIGPRRRRRISPL